MVEALKKEITLRKEEFPKAQVRTIYFGGGTPSVLDISELKSILDTIYNNYEVSKTAEITLEANPDDFFEDEKLNEIFLKDLKSLGINRLSIGIQSFFEEDLKLMNRAHNALQAEVVLKKATQYFENITIDLIYGIPGLTDEKWNKNIETTLSFNIPHISAYALTVESKTALDKFIQTGKIPPIDEEQSRRQFYQLVNILTQKNYIHYELSNFGKKGFFSENNTAYWTGKKYIGIGPSAHSYNGTQRSWNIANNTKYIQSIEKGVLPCEVEDLSISDRYNELIMTGLRTKKGVSLLMIKELFGTTYYQYLIKQSEPKIKAGLLEISQEYLQTTEKGKFLSDGICADLFWVD